MPAAALEAARQTLGGAVAVSATLPVEQSAPLLAAARTVFTDAFTLTAAVCAAISFAIALASWRLLRSAGVGATIVDSQLEQEG